jgi:hypothetical protein
MALFWSLLMYNTFNARVHLIKDSVSRQHICELNSLCNVMLCKGESEELMLCLSLDRDEAIFVEIGYFLSR